MPDTLRDRATKQLGPVRVRNPGATSRVLELLPRSKSRPNLIASIMRGAALGIAIVLIAAPIATADVGLQFEGWFRLFQRPPRGVSDFSVSRDGALIGTSGTMVSTRQGLCPFRPAPGSLTIADPLSGGVYVGGDRSPFGLELFATEAGWTGPSPYFEDIGPFRGLAFSPDGMNLYAAHALRDEIVTFSREPVSAQLFPVQEQTNGACGVLSMADVVDLLVAGDGGHLYVASRGSGSIVIFERDSNMGHLRVAGTEPLPPARSRLGNSISVASAPNGQQIYVADESTSGIYVYDRDPEAGTLRLIQSVIDGNGFTGIAGIRAIAVRADGGAVYAAGTTDDAVVVFLRDAQSGELRFRQVHRNLVDRIQTLNGPRRIRISSTGESVYVAAGEFINEFSHVDLPTATPTITPGGPTLTPSMTPTRLATWTRTRTGTATRTKTRTKTRTASPTFDVRQVTWTPTETYLPTRTRTPTRTPTQSCTPSHTATGSPPTFTPTETPTATSTSIPTATSPPTQTNTPTSRDTQPPPATPTPTTTIGREGCAGDCDGDDRVSIAELVLGVRINMGLAVIDDCSAANSDLQPGVSIADLVRAVESSLAGCRTQSHPSPTATRLAICGAVGEGVGGPNVARAHGVTVTLNPGRRQALTSGINSLFCFADVEPGLYTLSATRNGSSCNPAGCWETETLEILDMSITDVFIQRFALTRGTRP